MLEDLDIKYGNTYDTELSETSTNAVQNQAIAKKFKKLDTELEKKASQTEVDESVEELDKKISKKVDKVSGKGLSTNDFDNEYKVKLDNLNSSLNNTLSSAKSYTNSEIIKVDNKINSEINRAKTSETNLSDRIDDLEEGLTNAFNEAKEYTDSEVKNNTNKINILNGTGEGSVKKTVKDEIAKVVDGAPEQFNTLKEISEYLNSHEDVASGLVESITKLETEKVSKEDIDSALSTESENPVQNKVITVALNEKVDKVSGKGLSTNDYTTSEKDKLASLENYNDSEIKSQLTELSERIDNLPKGDEFDKEGNYPLLHVGTADDLAGRGESVPAEFTFRASGGKSIKDGRAYIKRIKGNSVVWNNLWEHGRRQGSVDNSDGTANKYESLGFIKAYTSAINGHKLFVMASDKGSGIDRIYLNDQNQVDLRSGAIFEAKTETTTGSSLTIRTPAGVVANYDVSVLFVDLTQMFQAGNEPTTIEEFNARVATLGVDMNAYNEGQVIHCNTESIKSVGDNAWDEQWELGKLNSRGEPYADNTLIRPKNFTRVIPNETYYFHGTFGYGIYFYDADKNYVKTLYVNNNKLQIPSNAMYLKFNFPTDYGTTYKNDMCIRLAHTGYKTDYEPYWQDILPLPIIRKYFPDGMKKAGSAHDEIRYNKASGKWEYTKSKTGGGRIKGVDMGSMAWSLDSANQIFTSYTIMDLMTHPAEVSERNKGLLCSKYSPSRTYVASTMDDKSWLRIPKSVTIKDTSYTDAASFKAAMAGVILYYESNDWEWVELDAEDQNFRDYYNVADFGTEQSQSSVPSAPFSADIIYQFNAVDMIREHELEITELQNVIATMQAQLTALTNGGQ